MSIATQRAKERENRTPDVEVMHKMVKRGKLKSRGRMSGVEPGFLRLSVQNRARKSAQEPDVWAKAGCPGWPDVPGSGRMSGLQIRG